MTDFATLVHIREIVWNVQRIGYTKKLQMKYWKFDVINLIADYHVNENAVATLKLQLREAKNEKKHPFVDTDRDMLNRRIQQIECKIQEYQMYVDMVTLGFDVLNEQERTVLEYLYIEQYSTQKTAEVMKLTGAELKRLTQQALRNFVKVVSPL